MDLETLVEDYAAEGVGVRLYQLLGATVTRVIMARGYPISYSPTGRWDEDALSGLAHDWTMDKLLRSGQLEHLLLSNQTLRGFEIGLELSFRHFLIGQKTRSTLTNLFRRANAVLEGDRTFRVFVDTRMKASRLWGLASWQATRPFEGSDSELIAAGFKLPNLPVIRYRADARKLSPVLSDRNLARFLALLFQEVGVCLNLGQILTVLKYRFHLLEPTEISLEDILASDEGGATLRVGDTIGGGPMPEEELLVAETAQSVMRALTPRQRQVFSSYVQPDATLVSVADEVGCSKSTVDNELRRVYSLIRRNAGGTEEARAVYEILVELLDQEEKVGNRGSQ